MWGFQAPNMVYAAGQMKCGTAGYRNRDDQEILSIFFFGNGTNLGVVDHDVQAGDGVEAAALGLEVRRRKLGFHLRAAVGLGGDGSLIAPL